MAETKTQADRTLTYLLELAQQGPVTITAEEDGSATVTVQGTGPHYSGNTYSYKRASIAVAVSCAWAGEPSDESVSRIQPARWNRED